MVQVANDLVDLLKVNLVGVILNLGSCKGRSTWGMDVNSLGHIFRTVPRTGVIYVMAEAAKMGYQASDDAWCNFGQGQPEVGHIAGAPDRVTLVSIDLNDNEYAPVAGLPELRTKVADLYNAMYRNGKKSKYTAENVAICGGGRLGLTRTIAALGSINLGHFLPDYTAYEELLDIFRVFNPIPILSDPERRYEFSHLELRREIVGRGLGAILLSNPGNPSGKVISGSRLQAWVETTRELNCALIMDEFYSNYVWSPQTDNQLSVSAAQFVDDVNSDPVVLINGLTKNWRYPGWRVSWVVGPKAVIESVSSTGSFLDGGCSRPLQRAALPLLEIDYVRQETAAIHQAFRSKRTLMIDELRKMGVEIEVEPEGTFYVWGNLSGLPSGLSTGMKFFHEALRRKTIVVPGEFFDVNPGKRRPDQTSRYRQYVRFSFGPKIESLQTGLRNLSQMINDCKS
jgi:aspartate/methionine/tyrosine aminotransferase